MIVHYVIVVVASSTPTAETFVDKSYQNAFMKRMHKQRQSDKYTDVTLQSSNVDIRCHRNVLAAASDYLNAMFQCDVEDPVQMDMKPEILTAIVDYIYTGEMQLDVDNVESLLKACDVLQLDTLKTACESFMLKQVKPANCVGFYQFAASYHLDELQQKARRMMRSEFKIVAFTDDFKKSSCKELIDLIKDDDVDVASEDVVFDAVLGWIQHDLHNRKSFMETIIEHVRLPYCTTEYLQNMRDVYDLLTPKCFEYLHEAMAFQASTVHQHSSSRTVPRNNVRMKSCLVVVGGQTSSTQGGNKKHHLCEYYEEDTSCWKQLTILPQSVGFMDSVCYTDRGLVVTGGSKGGAMDQCLLFDIGTKKWEEMPPLITKRYFHRSISLGDCVYVVGGKDVDTKPLASVECLKLKSREWSSLPAMAHAVYTPLIATYRNKLFVFGGRDAPKNNIRCTQVFDATQNKWSPLSPMPMECSFGAAVTMNDSIYVVGGETRTCLKYSPASDVWTKLNRPQQKHGHAPAVVWRGSILLAAGVGADQNPSAVEQFDPVTNTWSDSSIAQLKESLARHYMFNVDLYGL